MSVIAFGRRLRKLEAERHVDGAPFFVVWARTEDELSQAVTDLAVPLPADRVFVALWPFDEPLPELRWTTVRDLSDLELAAFIRNLPAEGETPHKRRSDLSGFSDDALIDVVLSAPVFDPHQRISCR